MVSWVTDGRVSAEWAPRVLAVRVVGREFVRLRLSSWLSFGLSRPRVVHGCVGIACVGGVLLDGGMVLGAAVWSFFAFFGWLSGARPAGQW